jgi:hypothetical protein
MTVISEKTLRNVVTEVRDPAALVLVAPRMRNDRDLVTMRPQRHAQLPLRAVREPHMVEVAVGEHDGLDIARRVPDLP